MALLSTANNCTLGRANLALLAVIARVLVTQGAGSWVPISGCFMACLTGQMTSLVSLSIGAARSEPHGVSWPGGTAGCTVLPVLGRVAGAGCTRGAGCARVHARCAHYTG